MYAKGIKNRQKDKYIFATSIEIQDKECKRIISIFNFLLKFCIRDDSSTSVVGIFSGTVKL